MKTLASKIRFACSAFILATITLIGLLNSSSRVMAATFPAQGDGTNISVGIFRLVIAPAFRPLLAPAVGTNGYPGYRSSDGRLTSPMLSDAATSIGRSSRHDRLLVGNAPVGLPSMGNVGYSDYAAIPSIFATSPAPTEEILTQVRSIAQQCVANSYGQCPGSDTRVPNIPFSWVMVKAGLTQGVTRKSLGMMQENVAGGVVLGAADPDFPARSFFDLFAEINLPPVSSTFSVTAFPATGAVLYNDTPLILTNLNVTSLPSSGVYLQGETTAVPLKFKSSNPPFWYQDDVFGYLVLAGHGTITNDCTSETALASAVLGPVGALRAELPIEWPVSTDGFPTPNTTYESVKDDDLVSFTIPGVFTIQMRNFVHGNLGSPITPPAVTGSIVYSTANMFVTLELSLDAQTWSPAAASGGEQAKMTHTSNTGSTAQFDTEMLQLNLYGNASFGPFELRESPTKQSLGKHTLRSTGQGLLVSSFFDVFMELSVDGGASWIPANRSIRVQIANPPCGAVGAHPVIVKSGNSAIVSWTDPAYRLQFRSSLTTSNWVDQAGSSPVTYSVTNTPKFFRLICP
jgi:hypothetical protein